MFKYHKQTLIFTLLEKYIVLLFIYHQQTSQVSLGGLGVAIGVRL